MPSSGRIDALHRTAATASTRRLLVAAAVVTLPVAWMAAKLGFGIATDAPMRTLPLLVALSVAEEIVFRGAMQPWLAAWIGRRDPMLHGVTASNVATSVVFAALHLLRHPPLLALAVLPVSLVLGAVRERSGRVWPSAVLHVCFNLALYAASAMQAGAH